MATYYSPSPEYWQRSQAARSYAMDVLSELQGLPGGFSIGPSFLGGVDAPNAAHQKRLKAHLAALNLAELHAVNQALASEGGLDPRQQPWGVVVELEDVADMAAGWIARLIKQSGGVSYESFV